MALQELSRRARLLGADAVVGVRIDVEVLGQAGGMLMACATGTAVALEPAAVARRPPVRQTALQLTTLSSKGQLTIPRQLRESLGLTARVSVDFGLTWTT